MFTLDPICGSFCFINQIWIEYVKFIALDDFRWGVVVIIMCLVILVPFITHLYTIEIAWFPRPIFASPLWFRDRGYLFFASKNLLVFLDSSRDFPFIKSGGGCRKVFVPRIGKSGSSGESSLGRLLGIGNGTPFLVSILWWNKT